MPSGRQPTRRRPRSLRYQAPSRRNHRWPPPRHPLPSLSRPTAQRSVAAPDASSSYGPLSVRSPAQVPTPHPPGAAGPALTSRPPNPSPAEQPDGQQVPVQQDAPVPQRAPLLGYRLPPRILDARPGPQPQQATATLTATLGKLPVQRSVHVPPPLSRPGRPPASTTSGPAPAHRESLAGHSDPSAIAVTRGLAHRDPDGSIVFDLSPVPLPPGPPGSRNEPAIWPATITRWPEAVQRQEATEPADAPDPESASTTMPVTTSPVTTSPVTARSAMQRRPRPL